MQLSYFLINNNTNNFSDYIYRRIQNVRSIVLASNSYSYKLYVSSSMGKFETVQRLQQNSSSCLFSNHHIMLFNLRSVSSHFGCGLLIIDNPKLLMYE